MYGMTEKPYKKAESTYSPQYSLLARPISYGENFEPGISYEEATGANLSNRLFRKV